MQPARADDSTSPLIPESGGPAPPAGPRPTPVATTGPAGVPDRGTAQWPVGMENPADPLLGCLLAIAALYERPTSPDALIAGLPVSERGLDPDLFVRAAERIN